VIETVYKRKLNSVILLKCSFYIFILKMMTGKQIPFDKIDKNLVGDEYVQGVLVAVTDIMTYEDSNNQKKKHLNLYIADEVVRTVIIL